MRTYIITNAYARSRIARLKYFRSPAIRQLSSRPTSARDDFKSILSATDVGQSLGSTYTQEADALNRFFESLKTEKLPSSGEESEVGPTEPTASLFRLGLSKCLVSMEDARRVLGSLSTRTATLHPALCTALVVQLATLVEKTNGDYLVPVIQDLLPPPETKPLDEGHYTFIVERVKWLPRDSAMKAAILKRIPPNLIPKDIPVDVQPPRAPQPITNFTWRQFFFYLRRHKAVDLQFGRNNRLRRWQSAWQRAGAVTPLHWNQCLEALVASHEPPRLLFLHIVQWMEQAAREGRMNLPVFDKTLRLLLEHRRLRAAWWLWKALASKSMSEAHKAEEGRPHDAEWIINGDILRISITVHGEHHHLRKAFLELNSWMTLRATLGLSSEESTRAINRLLVYLNRNRFTDAVFLFWQEMSSQYGVQRDVKTLSLILRAATYGSNGGETEENPSIMESVATVVADRFTAWMAARRRKGLEAEEAAGAPFKSRVMTLLGLEREDSRNEVMWDGIIAWQRARLIFLEVILGQWPGLIRVESPVPLAGHPTQPRTYLNTYGEPPSVEWIQPSYAELLEMTTSPSYQHHIEFQAEGNPHVIPPPPSTCLYPHIVLDERAFRDYIQLLGEHSLARQIPLTLAWMRALRLKPERETVALAVAYYQEVTTAMQPLVSAYGALDHGEVGRLLRWLRSWLGEDMPSEDEVVMAWREAHAARIRVAKRYSEP